jgi:hypothetical protein
MLTGCLVVEDFNPFVASYQWGCFFFETTFSRTFKKKKYLSAKILDQFFFEYCFHLGLGGGWRCPEMSSGHQE